jgi:hypothetical protein
MRLKIQQVASTFEIKGKREKKQELTEEILQTQRS